ncbi:ATP-binding protein [Leptospira idonii]|uniref:histidine kinase n=1 Tax=Leptospira idonii TaxID=1193500 RepID=A0A4R9LXX0_9LEPT|nr:ATP-binding protein [Leptospira idonii]TGN19183.1 PAS domain S-box protein [Leptospira idonii]
MSADIQSFLFGWMIAFNFILAVILFYLGKKKDFNLGLSSLSLAFFILAVKYLFLALKPALDNNLLNFISETFTISAGYFVFNGAFRVDRRRTPFLKLGIVLFLAFSSTFILFLLNQETSYIAIPSSILIAASFAFFGWGAIQRKDLPKSITAIIASISWFIALHRIFYPFLIRIEWYKNLGIAIPITLMFVFGITMIVAALLLQQRKLEEANEELNSLQKKMRALHTRLLIMNNQVPALIYSIELNPVPRFIYLNHRLEELTGYSIIEFYTDPEILSKISVPEDIKQISDFLSGQTPILLRWKNKEGKTLWIEHYTSISYDLEGNPLTLDGVAMDVTNTKTAEGYLEEEKNLNIAVFDNAASILVITSETGVIENFNYAAENLMGISRKDAIGKFIYDIMLLDTDRKTLQEVIEDISDFRKIADSIILRCISKDNQIRFLEWRIGTIAAENDQVKKIIWIGIDQTQKRKAEIELRDLNKSLENKVLERTLELQNSNEELNQTLAALRETQEKLIQSEKLASLGQLISGLSHEINNPIGAIKASTETLSSEWHDDYNSQARSKIEDKILRLTNLPYPELGLTTGLANRKLRKELNQKLQETDIKLSDKYSELLTDSGISEIDEDAVRLIQSCDSEEDFAQLRKILVMNRSINHIMYAIKRLSRITYALKNFAGMQSNTSLSLHSLEDTIHSAIALYKEHFVRNIRLITDFQFDGRIHCNPADLTQMWSHFIWNSIQAMQHKGEIEITTTAVEKFAEVAIIDNGPGIAPENQSKVFQPFFSTKDAGDGLGLGLYLIQEIVKRHSGNIHFESSPGKTKFVLRFPIGY